MKLFERSFISMRSLKKKYVLIFLLFFIFSNAIIGSFITMAQVNQSNETLRLRARSEYYLGKEGMDTNVVPIDVTMLKDIGKLPEVDYFSYNQEITGKTTEIVRTLLDGNVVVKQGNEQSFTIQTSELEYLLQHDTQLQLLQYTPLNSLNKQPNLKPLFISKFVAETNELQIGDTIQFRLPVYMPFTEVEDENLLGSVEQTFTVTGIFDTSNIQLDAQSEKIRFANILYTTNAAIENYLVFAKQTYLDAGISQDVLQELAKEQMAKALPSYVLTDDALQNDFVKKAMAMLPAGYAFKEVKHPYLKLLADFEKIGGMLRLILIVTVGGTVLILSAMLVYFLYQRKKELGIYLALGETKIRIVKQIMLELLLVASVAIVLSAMTGIFVSKQMERIFIKDEAAQIIEGDEQVQTQTQKLLNVQTILLILGTEFVTILLSGIVPVIYILRLPPKEILL